MESEQLQMRKSSTTLTESVSKKRSRAGKTPAAKIVWTPEEDAELRKLVEIYGDQSWHRLCKLMPNKTEIRCFKRWKLLKTLDENPDALISEADVTSNMNDSN